MWTYKAGQENRKPESPIQTETHSAESWGKNTGVESAKKDTPPAAVSADTGAKNVRPVSISAFSVLPAAAKHGRLFGVAYLAGILAGGLLFASMGQNAAAYIEFYRDALLELFHTAPPLQLFSGQFLAAFLQLSLTVLCGLCAFGMPFLFLLLILRGAVFGCFCAAVLAAYGPRGALITAILFWLPEVCGALIQAALSIWSMRSAMQIGTVCFGRNDPCRPETPRHLLNVYLTLCLCSLLPCGLSALLALLFGPMIGG